MTLVAHEVDPLIDPADLQPEIREALEQDRRTTTIPSAADRISHERIVMFDTALALLIRLRLRIDAAWVREVIEATGSSSDHDADEWTRAIAEHIAYLTNTENPQETP